MKPCPACERLKRADASDPFFIASLRESVLLLHKHQRYEGWCMLWLREHAEHLADLPTERQARLWQDVSQAVDAMRRVLGPVRINYECLGNVVPHIHWHLIPRRETDPDPRSTVWVRPTAETDCGCGDAVRDQLVAHIRAALP